MRASPAIPDFPVSAMAGTALRASMVAFSFDLIIFSQIFMHVYDRSKFI